MKVLLSILLLAVTGCRGIQEATRTSLTAEEHLEIVARARELAKESGLISETEKAVVMASDPKVAYYRMAGRFAQYSIIWPFSDGSALVVYGEGNIPELGGAQVMRKPNKRAEVEFPVYTPHAIMGAPRADKDFPIVDTPAYKGAILPAEEAKRHRYLAKHYKQFWTPTTNDIARAEAKLTAFIESSTDTHAAEICKKLRRFRRQYVGYTADGERCVLCSFLPGVKEGQDPFAGLRRSFIKVFDGGPSFWEIYYCVEKDQCDGFRVDLGFL